MRMKCLYQGNSCGEVYGCRRVRRFSLISGDSIGQSDTVFDFLS
jgi:hypothetical protein